MTAFEYEAELAALREELADSKALVQVVAKKAAASEIRSLKLAECLDDVCNTLYCQTSEGESALRLARAALKPAESGAGR